MFVINQTWTTASTGLPWALARDFVIRRSAGLDFNLGEVGAEPAWTLHRDVNPYKSKLQAPSWQ